MKQALDSNVVEKVNERKAQKDEKNLSIEKCNPNPSLSVCECVSVCV
jgi:hypothetical protein